MVRVVATVGVLSVPLAISSAAAAGVPAANVDGVQETVGQVITRVGASLPQRPNPAATKAPASKPAPARAAPQPTGQSAGGVAKSPAPAPSPAAAGSSPETEAAPKAQASSSKAPSPDPPAKASSGAAEAPDPTDAPQSDSATRPAATVEAGDGADTGSLPFTGAPLVPVLAVATLLLLAGIALRRRVRA